MIKQHWKHIEIDDNSRESFNYVYIRCSILICIVASIEFNADVLKLWKKGTSYFSCIILY